MRHFILAAFLAGAAQAVIAEPTAEQKAFFEQKIAPILSENCFKCHSATEGKTKGGLALDSRDALAKGGESGKIVIVGDPAKSPLIQRVISKDPDEQMPPKDGALTAQQVADLTAWIKMGAPDPRTAPAPIASTYNSKAAKTHWSWQPLRPVQPPAVQNRAWAKTQVDQFILAKLESAGMTPNAMADRATLIRRAYFDLIGLPPMPWEVQAFVDDKAPNAWEKVIDRLLASPHYGERWGRYWLDVARYSDTKGDNARRESPVYVDAWTYRDYVIESFNSDKPYDRFILEQIAADKLPTAAQDKKSLAALGFITVGDRFNGNANDIINDRIDVVTKGFLGLTVSCARCHDHMFDPIPQKDYYSLHGIFASTAEPKENPIIAAQQDAKLYQDYLKAREDSMKEAKDFATREIQDMQKIFREHVATLLLAGRKEGPARGELLRKAGLNIREIDGLLRLLRGDGNQIRRNSVFSPWARFVAIPAKDFAAEAPRICEKIAAGEFDGPRRRQFPVNPVVAAMFKGKKPTSLEDVAGYYAELFKEAGQKFASAKAPGSGGLQMASAVGSTQADKADSEAWDEIRFAPFREDPMANFTPEEISVRLPRRAALRFQALLSTSAKVDLTHPGAPKRAMAVEDSAAPRNSPVFIRGEAGNKGEIVPRRFLEVLGGPERPEFKLGSGRLELAQAIANRANPLTSRVMVNRIWLHHFGDGIVTTPDDFGTMAAPPSHPELLDYLSQQFIQGNWSVKRLHKLIMMSAVYQQKSDTNEKFAAVDPNNRLLWRYNIRRLDFEPLRDSLLYIAGKLDLKTGGQPVNILSEPYSMRRSVYGYIDRGELPEMMAHFDFANPGMPTGKRHETTVPQQALFMMNSPLVVDVSRKLLQRPEMAQAKNDAQRVHALYWMIFQRAPRPDEIEIGTSFVTSAAAAEPEPAEPVAASAPAKLGKGKKAGAAKAEAMKRYRSVILQNEGEKVERKPLSPWEKYTQALLMANEAVYFN